MLPRLLQCLQNSGFEMCHKSKGCHRSSIILRKYFILLWTNINTLKESQAKISNIIITILVLGSVPKFLLLTTFHKFN